MLQFISEPGTISYANNPVVYRIRTTNAVDGLPFRAKGARSVMTTTQTEFEIDGFILLVFQEGDGTPTDIMFTAKANPIGDEQFLYNGDFFDLAQKIINHRLIAPHVNITYTDNNGVKTFFAEAREVEANWIVYWNYDGLAGTNEILNYEYTPTNVPVGYRVGVEVFFEKEYELGKWESVSESQIVARDNGDDVYINISDILSRQCRASLLENPFSRYNRTIMPVLADNVRRFYVRFKESAKNVNPVWTVKPISLVMNGGLQTHEWLAYGGLPYSATRALLTYQPNIRTVPRVGVEWFSWYNYTGAVQEIELEIYDQNDLSTTIFRPATRISVPPFRTATFCVSPNALQLPSSVHAFLLLVVDATTRSPVAVNNRWYVIEDDYPPQTRFLGYLNAFGVPEVAICQGDFTRKVQIADTRAQGVRGSESAGQLTRTERRVTDYTVQYTYRSGYINSAQKETYTELRLSSVLFDITTSSYLALVLKAEQSNNADQINDTTDKIYSNEWICEPRVALQNFGLDRLLQQAATLNEPVFRIIPKDPLSTTNDVNSKTNDIGNPNYDIPKDAIVVGELTDTDMILFARLNAAGEVGGYILYPNKKYQRLVRGIPLDAPSHLDGLGLKDTDGVVHIAAVETNGDFLTSKNI